MNSPLFSKDIPVYFKSALSIISAIAIVLATFCVSGEWQWWQILVSVAFFFILVILATYLVRHFYKNDSGDRQNLETFKTLQQSLEEFTVTSSKTVTMLVKEVFEKISDTIEEPKRTEIKERISSLEERIFRELSEEIYVWKRAGHWLETNYKSLAEKAIKHLVKEYRELESPGGCLSSMEQRKKFEESIDEHLQCILQALQTPNSGQLEELEHKQHICERRAYRVVFSAICDYIVELKSKSKSTDNDVLNLLSGIFEELVRRL